MRLYDYGYMVFDVVRDSINMSVFLGNISFMCVCMCDKPEFIEG